MSVPAPYTLPMPAEDPWAPAWQRYLRKSARLLVDWPLPLDPHLVRPYADLKAALGRVLADRPGDLYAALSLPQVAGPLHTGHLAEAVPHLLVELARRRALGREGVWWPPPVGRLLSAPLGAERRFDPPRPGMLFVDGEIELGPEETWVLGRAERPVYWPLEQGGWLAGADNNPLWALEAHPEKHGNALSLGAATPAEWVASLDEARRLIAAGLPALAAEHRRLLAMVVPVGGPQEVSESASFRELIGVVYVSLHPSPLKMAEALVHELQHTKLNLLWHSDPVLVDGGAAVHVSPVRPDPRPLWGVLLAVHAFLPVVELFRRLDAQGHPLAATDAFRRRWRESLDVNHEGLEVVLGAARPTAVGARLLAGMKALEAEQWAERPRVEG